MQVFSFEIDEAFLRTASFTEHLQRLLYFLAAKQRNIQCYDDNFNI